MAKGEKKVKLSKEELKAKKDEMKKAGFGMMGEFKKFVMRGNVLDMAIGVIVGGAFSKIVTSLVNDIIMPLIGSLVGTVNFTDLKANIGDTVIPYGSFIQNVVDFLLVALVLFLALKIATTIGNKARRKKEEEAVPEVIKSDETKLLEEIRDLLKEKKSK